VSFDAPTLSGRAIVVDAAFVRRRTSALLADDDLARYVL
jgi:ATP-dependent protease HslVU (ClpYQ) ATPase subunit